MRARWQRSCLGAIALSTLYGLCFALPGQGERTGGECARDYIALNRMTTELPKEEVAQRRIRSAESVVKLVDEMGVLCRQGIDDHAIDLIVDNLKDDDDTVRSLIAISLGNIGAKSYRVIPALKIALKMAGPPNNGAPLNVGTLKLSLGPDLGSSSSIPVSIKKIMEAHKLEYGIGDTH